MLEVFAATHWQHGAGVAAGATAAAAGVALLAYGACLQESAACPPPRLPHQSGPPLPPRALITACNALGAFVVLLLLVRAASPDPSGAAAGAFPDACTKPQGCGRIALRHPHRAGHEAPLALPTTLAGARGAVRAWMGAAPRVEVLYDGPDGGGEGGGKDGKGGKGGKGGGGKEGEPVLIRARVVTFLWGFAGGCAPGSCWARAARVGGVDAAVNAWRCGSRSQASCQCRAPQLCLLRSPARHSSLPLSRPHTPPQACHSLNPQTTFGCTSRAAPTAALWWRPWGSCGWASATRASTPRATRRCLAR